MPDYDEIIGREKLSEEIKNYLLNPRKPSVSIFKNIFSKFSFVNFAGGAAIASVLGFFAFNKLC